MHLPNVPPLNWGCMEFGVFVEFLEIVEGYMGEKEDTIFTN